MIIGKGDIASVLTDREDIIFFASGVSNSKETRDWQFNKEISLLLDQPKDKHLVYFSSLCIYYSKSLYARHKRIMESAIKHSFPSYTIVRLGNIDWGVNPNTLINYLKDHRDAKIEEVYRHVVSLAEFNYWMGMIKPGGQNEMNIPGRMVWVPDLYRELYNTNVVW